MPLHNRNLKTRFPDFCWRVLMGSSCLIRTLSQARLTLPHFTACLYPIPRVSRSALPALSSGNRMVFPFFSHPCPDSAPPSVECSSLLSRNLLPVFGWRARIVFFDSPHIHAQPHISSVASEPGTHHVTIQEPLPVFGWGTRMDFIDCLTPDHQYSASITPGTLFFPAVRIREHLLILSATPAVVQAQTSLPPRPMSTGVTDIRTIPFSTHLSHSGTHRFFFH